MKIIKYLFPVLTGLVLSSGAHAQKIPLPMLQFGPKLGANINRIDNESFKKEFKLGYHAGVFAVVRLSKKLQLQPEVLFNQVNTKTAKDFDEISNVNNLKDISLQYLSIPLLLNITPARVLSFQVGAQYGILMKGDDDLVENGKAAFKSGDFGVLGGLQFNFLHFKISARYGVGLSELSDLPDRKDWKSQTIQLGVGWRII